VALVIVAALLVVFGTFRIGPLDNAQHLAMGQWIWEHGQPMTTNTLSWTHPDHPNAQQYPLYQVVVYLLQSGLGFWSLSVFCAVSWFVAVLTWGLWAGGVSRLAKTVPLWFVAVIGVQRHLVSRPEALTLLGLAVLLVLFERWRADPRSRAPLAGMVVTLWLMLLCHQLYVVGVVLLAGFVVHVAATRRLAGRGLVDETDAALPLPPLLLTLAGGLFVMGLGPLGPRGWLAPWALVTTMTSLGSSGDTGARSAELEPIWTDPLGGPVTVVLLVAVGVAGWRARGRWSVLELGVLVMGLGMVGLALRGIPFFALAAASVITRWDDRAPGPLFPPGSPVPGAGALATLLVAAMILIGQLTPREYVYMRRQQGLGRSVGEWGDAFTTFLREHPPPGEMLNIGWAGANQLVWGVYPVRRVFVDGRWESYPKPFLTQTIAAEEDQAELDRLIEAWQPGFVVGEMRDIDQQNRVATLIGRGWTLVFVDSIAVVVVPPGEATAAYRAEFGTTCAEADLPDWRPEHPILHAEQQIRFAGFLERCGEPVRAVELFAKAAEHLDHPAVRRGLRAYDRLPSAPEGGG